MTADKEKRRAISRTAARKRRGAESEVFRDLSRLLPLQPTIRDHLDKPSIIRLTLSYIRMHTLLQGRDVGTTIEACCPIMHNQKMEERASDGEVQLKREEMEEINMYLKILEGFMMVISTEGDIMFLSENVSKHMGLTQVELMGHNIFDFAHPGDQGEIRNNLRLSTDEAFHGVKREFIIRIKSALTHRGRTSNLKSATWKVLHCHGRAKMCVSPPSVSCLLLTCKPLPLTHTLLSTHTFTSQHSMDMKFTYCDQRVITLLGYSPEELVGRSIYQFCHTQDSECLSKNHVNLCYKSQSVSNQYRMLVRGGGYVWVESHCAVIPSVRPTKSRLGPFQPLCILCVTYVLSGVEEPSLQLSSDQTSPGYVS